MNKYFVAVDIGASSGRHILAHIESYKLVCEEIHRFSNTTFGLMHTVEKASEILVKVKSMGGNKLQTITPDDFRNLAKDFKLTLPEKFLYNK